MAKTKNRKSFQAVIQAKDKKARIYRIKKNVPVLIGFMEYIRLTSASTIQADIIWHLKYNGHVLAGHEIDAEFTLTVV